MAYISNFYNFKYLYLPYHIFLSSVEPKNWYFDGFFFFSGAMSYVPGPITLLLYFKYYLCLAFESWLVSKIILSKKERTLSDTNAGEAAIDTLFDRGDGMSYWPGPSSLPFWYSIYLLDVNLDHPEPFIFLYCSFSLGFSLTIGISISSSNETCFTSVMVGTVSTGFSRISLKRWDASFLSFLGECFCFFSN